MGVFVQLAFVVSIPVEVRDRCTDIDRSWRLSFELLLVSFGWFPECAIPEINRNACGVLNLALCGTT